MAVSDQSSSASFSFEALAGLLDQFWLLFFAIGGVLGRYLEQWGHFLGFLK